MQEKHLTKCVTLILLKNLNRLGVEESFLYLMKYTYRYPTGNIILMKRDLMLPQKARNKAKTSILNIKFDFTLKSSFVQSDKKKKLKAYEMDPKEEIKCLLYEDAMIVCVEENKNPQVKQNPKSLLKLLAASYRN